MKTWQKIKENPNLINKYLVREKVVDVIRAFFKTRGFHEVSTPILVPTPSCEPNLEVFETELRTAGDKNRRGFLIMSPEYSLKKLLAAGMGNIFEITKVFRNEEEISSFHNPEFTMIEWYRVKADYRAVMEDVENLLVEIVQKINPQIDLKNWSYQGETYDLSLPWTRISVAEAFKKYAGINKETLLDNRKLLQTAKNKGYEINAKTTWEQVFFQIFFNEIETEFQKLHKPVILYDYPVQQAGLAKRKDDDLRLAERFEFFLAGLELGNCFSELIDPAEQKERFKKDLEERKKMGKTEYPMDSDFIQGLKSGLPAVSGIAVGVDRLVMLAADVPTISDTLFFPAKEMFDL